MGKSGAGKMVMKLRAKLLALCDEYSEVMTTITGQIRCTGSIDCDEQLALMESFGNLAAAVASLDNLDMLDQATPLDEKEKSLRRIVYISRSGDDELLTIEIRDAESEGSTRRILDSLAGHGVLMVGEANSYREIRDIARLLSKPSCVVINKRNGKRVAFWNGKKSKKTKKDRCFRMIDIDELTVNECLPQLSVRMESSPALS